MMQLLDKSASSKSLAVELTHIVQNLQVSEASHAHLQAMAKGELGTTI